MSTTFTCIRSDCLFLTLSSTTSNLVIFLSILLYFVIRQQSLKTHKKENGSFVAMCPSFLCNFSVITFPNKMNGEKNFWCTTSGHWLKHSFDKPKQAIFLYPPQTLFVVGILFSRCPCVHPCVRPSVRHALFPLLLDFHQTLQTCSYISVMSL